MNASWLRIGLVWLVAGCAGHASLPEGAQRIEVEVAGGPAPFTGLEPNDGSEEFKFVVVTDRTGDHREGVFRDAMARINLLEPAFVVSVGDLIEGYTEDRTRLAAEWDEMEGFIDELRMPFFYAAGNHDISNAVMAEVWRERLGPSYYHFRYKGVSFVVLNSELFTSVANPGEPVGGPDTQAEQMAFVERVLAENADARWTIVVVHQPLWDLHEVHEDWLRVEALLGERPYTVFAGHFHRYTSQRRHDRKFLTLATTGGGSAMRGIDRGEFDHVALVSMTDDGPVLANLMLDGIHDEDVRTEATRDVVRELDRAVHIVPGMGDGELFQAGEVRITVRNEGGAPLAYSGHFHAGRDLTPSPERASGKVAPGNEESLIIALEANSTHGYGELSPATATWTLTGEKEDGSPVEVETYAWLFPEQRFAVPAVDGGGGAIELDGDLSDWDALPFVVDHRPGRKEDPNAVTFRFGLRHDEENLYLGVEVTDPTPYSSPEASARHQDAVSIVLDARTDPERSENAGFFRAIGTGAVSKMLFAWLAPVEPADDPIFGVFLPPLPEGTRRASRTTATGYTAELAVPASFLDERQGGPWQDFRLNVSVLDFDAAGESRGTRWWRPSRFGMSGVLPVEGAGTFERR